MGFMLRAALAVVLVLAACARAEAIDHVDPKKKVELAPGEGVVVLRLRTQVPLEARISGDGRFIGGSLGITWGGIGKFVIRAPEGRYRWNRFSQGDRFWDMRGDDDYAFEVKAGVVSYPGDFNVAMAGNGLLSFEWQNRATDAMSFVDHQYSAALSHLPFRYTGRMPDPFPAFFAERLKAAGRTADQTSEITTRYEYDEAAAPLPANELFRVAGTLEVGLSPDGARIAEHALGNEGHVVRVIDVASGRSTEIYKGATEVAELRWVAPQRLAVELGPGLLRRVVLHDFTVGRDGALKVRTMEFPVPGTILGVSRANPNQVAFLRGVAGDPDPWQVYRVEIGAREVSRTNFQRRLRLDLGLDDDSGWLVDDAGVMRVVVAKHEGKNTVLYRDDARARWRPLMVVPMDRWFVAQMLDAKGRIVAITDVGRAQRDLVAIDPASGRVAETLFSRARVDLGGVVTDRRTGRIVGVRYVEGGAFATHYLDDAGNALQARLQSQFTGRQVGVLQEDEQRVRALVATMGPTDPGHFYLFDGAKKTLEEVGQVSPQLASYRFVEPRVFTVRSRDGFDIQSILFMPRHDGRAPLVVMPHGGPLGVSDTLSFDTDAQYLASRGYAVLKVNYRGSDGFGRDFFEAGYRQRGRQIEDDIELALDHALANHPLDPDRVALVGASYGGYSALMGLVRSPRYRCAVAISAPTDVALSFTAADWSGSAEMRELMAQLTGDPRKSLDDLVAISPLYQYAKLDRPILLVHGVKDERVPVEHAERLRRVLALAGRAPKVVYFNEGHAFRSLDAAAGSAIATAAFLDEHVGARAAALADVRADDAPPSVLVRKPVTYPRSALDAGATGTVKVAVDVAADGSVARATVAESSGSRALDEAALATVREWTFRPKRQGGRDVAGSTVVPVSFAIDGG